MTDWKEVQGSQDTKPAEFDTTSSSEVVYQRRNIEQIEVENPMDDTKTKLWKYDEREMTRKEYEEVRVESQQEQIDQNRADIDFISAMSDISL